MVNTVRNSFEQLGYRYQKVVEKPIQTIYKLGMGLENGNVDCIIDIRIPDKQVLIFSSCPVNIPENKRRQIAEFITRANHNLILGSFELDFDDGDLRYKSNYIYDDTYPQSQEVFIRNFLISFRMMDKYIPGIMSVLYANLDPKIAITQIENVTDPILN